MRRTPALGALVAVVVAWAWLRLESPGADGDLLFAAGAFGVLPFLAPRRLRFPAIALAVLLTARAAFDTFSPPKIGDRFADGLLLYYDVALPFDPAEQPRMHGLVLLAVVGFTFGATWAVATRRPLLAAALVVAGAGWPTTLRHGESPLVDGAVILATALALVAGASTTPRAWQAVLAGAAVVAAAAGIAAVPAVAKGAFLPWEQWDPYTRPDLPVSVNYVWETNYRPLVWPKKKTVVFRVKAPPSRNWRWRATTLDMYHGETWLEYPHGVDYAPLRDPLLPADALEGSRLVEARVEIEALQDTYLIGPSIPVRFEVPGELGEVLYQTTGTAHVPAGIPRGTRYRAVSLASRPAPARLVRSEPNYDRRHDQYLTLQSRTDTPVPPPFGTPGREAELGVIFRENPGVADYRPLYEQAIEVVGGTSSPYLAAVRLEDWFRSTGGFRYDQTAPRKGGMPALVEFVTRTRRGYCQHFAGAMALMLRYVGIPARVAAGFTSGRYDNDEQEWVVTDHDAHTWVEVWFEDFGWLPFDPTPGRGTLDGAYSSASTAFSLAAVAALGAGADAADAKLEGGRFERVGESAAGARDRPGDTSGVATEDDPSLLRLLALLAAALLVLVAVVKWVVRRARFLTRDPRRVASACRRELADFLRDQRFAIPESATVSELGEVVRRELGVDAAAFAAAFTAARYGPPEGSAAAARQARRELRRLERAVRGRLSKVERVRGLVSVRSFGLT